jgi:AAA15 family ATPase/GTPase
MLLRFRARNHLSLRDAEEISLVASTLDDDPSGLIPCPAIGQNLLPAVVVYGANASGKSNLVNALWSMCADVRVSHRLGEPGGGIPRTPFLLDSTVKASPSLFEADFILDGIRHTYGYEASDTAFIAEWLYAYPKGRRQILFRRDGQNFEFGRTLKGRNTIVAEATRDNSLFLSAAAQMNHASLSAVAAFFNSLEHVKTEEADLALQFGVNEKVTDSRISRFIQNIGTGVCGISIGKRKPNYEDEILLRALGDKVDLKIKQKAADGTLELPTFQFSHLDRDGAPVLFQAQQESEGTRRLLFMLVAIFHALDNGTPVIIDELNAHLHTQACEAILALFCDPETNPKGAQLIATTHDTNLLRSPYLRRDQVWFAEKDREGATHLYPLTDIRTRKGDNIEKGYLQGRYGAIPYAGPISDLIKGR